MKKIAVLILGLLFFSSFLYAGPFGLSNGMTLEEVTEACNGEIPKRIAQDDRYFIIPSKSHSTFTTYIAWISEDYGLYHIRAISDKIHTNNYGKELQNAFYSFEPRIENTYGKGSIFDGITDSNTIWDQDKYWFKALSDGARDLYAEWYPKQGQKVIKDDLTYIRLWVSNADYDNGILLLDYEFVNHKQVEAQEDDVL